MPTIAAGALAASMPPSAFLLPTQGRLLVNSITQKRISQSVQIWYME